LKNFRDTGTAILSNCRCRSFGCLHLRFY